MRGIALLLLACLAGCVAPPTPAGTPPPVPGARPITDVGYHNEPFVAVDPIRPASVVAIWQVPATTAWSADSGRTWATVPLPDTTAWAMSGDPSVYFDADGHAYALYIAFGRPLNYDTLGKDAPPNGIFVNRSDDGGRTWRAAPTAVIRQPARAGVPFEDKPMAAVDRYADPARRGNLYVAWTEFRRHESVILFARSTDGGRSFSAPVLVSDRTGSPKDTVGAEEGTDVAVGPDGSVYVVWSDSLGIWIDRSDDAGRHFGADRLVAHTPDIVFSIPGIERANGYPGVEVDPRSGRLYVAWVDPRRGAPTVFLATSGDRGATWSPPREVGGQTRTDSLPRFFSSISFDPSTTRLALGYYHVLPSGEMRYELAWSDDAGRSFDRLPWGAPFTGNGEFLGDYTGVDAADGLIYGAWTELASPPSSAPSAAEHEPVRARVVVGRAGPQEGRTPLQAAPR
ncbi:MAG TPA: sialidase family protein [Longimicrobiaceae bacterium]|nr:sialidase family protein [Longimicrobiaceae bacterium]